MKRAVIFGAGRTGKRVYDQIKGSYEVVAFLDNDKSKWGSLFEEEVPVIGNAEKCDGLDCDIYFIAVLAGIDTIKKELLNAGVSYDKINTSFVEWQKMARSQFLQDYSKLVHDVPESVVLAEGGVFQGDFAAEIASAFPNRQFYLFDTFKGFDSRDTTYENEKGYSNQKEGHFGITNVEMVLKKLPDKEKVVIREGYFPETLDGMKEEQYLFVSLDFDLYKPTYEGLKYFYPRMVHRGCILIDDYFGGGYLGIKEAVEQYEREFGELIKLPIGDNSGIAVYKN